ncbi:MAG: plastocyanin/azurin family copper-binding protein [Hyphomicrobiaceae bacterium]|jgi:plastocyanin
MMHVVGASLLAAAIAMAPGIVYAAEYTISQKGKQFSVTTLSAQVGDTVVFVNDDRFAHNIYSDTPGFEFDFRKQMPGKKDVLELDKAIVFDVKCAIHPRMKVTISVK